MNVHATTDSRLESNSVSYSEHKSTPIISRYVLFVKPHIITTFTLVGVAGTVLAEQNSAHFHWGLYLKVIASTFLLSAAAESWTNLIDRKIDSVMERTKRRALPVQTITTTSAGIFALALTISGSLLAASLGVIPFVFFSFAFLDNVIIYSLLTKKVTPWSIVLGSPVSLLVLWAGYTAGSKPIPLSVFLLGIAITAWVPIHIWAIATRYSKDYAKAHVPMAPVVWHRSSLALAMFISGIIMIGTATPALAMLGTTTPVHLFFIAILTIFSLLIVLFASLLPWHTKFAPVIIKTVTLYLVMLLITAICFVA